MQTILTIVLALLFNLAISGNLYLKIVNGNEDISYPPNTKFELFDANKRLIRTEKTLVKDFIISSRHTLIIYPRWKETADVYTLEDATLKIESNEAYMKSIEDYHNTDLRSGSKTVHFKKTIEPSEITGKYNLTLEGSNGLIFTYTDGKVVAIQNGNELTIIGKYVIESEQGTLKVSFNPNNKETWWVFQSIRK